jgi:beta-alanine--pyruvate transaminase
LDTRAVNSLDAFWMGFTNNRAFKANPRLLASAKGMHYFTPDGRAVLDGCAGLWCVNAGHGREKIVEAIRRQAGEMDFAPTFNLGHPLAFQLASRLRDIFPSDLDRVFFCNSGSEAVDSALKIALAYQRALGQGSRTRLIGRERGYHGVGFGGMSVGGMAPNRRAFGPLLAGVDHLRHTHGANPPFTAGEGPAGAELADDLTRLVGLHGADTIAAVIVEPVAGSTGVLPPPLGYLQRLRDITTRHGILLIFDEVITAFGRLGAPTASDYFGVVPDLITTAKGITNATVPLGAVAVHSKIYDTVVSAAAPGIELAHGYTYSGHPLAAAAALATLDLYTEECLFERAAELRDYFGRAVQSFAGRDRVVDTRNIGLMGAVELEPRADAAPGTRALAVYHRCFDEGLLVRCTGETIALSPPLIIERTHIDEIVDKLARVIAEVD